MLEYLDKIILITLLALDELNSISLLECIYFN